MHTLACTGTFHTHKRLLSAQHHATCRMLKTRCSTLHTLRHRRRGVEGFAGWRGLVVGGSGERGARWWWYQLSEKEAESGIVHFANHIGKPGLRGSGKGQNSATGAPCGYSRKCLLLATSNGGLMGETCRDFRWERYLSQEGGGRGWRAT